MKKYILPLILILLLTFTLIGDCWVAGYDHRIKLTIDHTKIDDTLTNFPVTAFFTAVQAEEIFTEFDADEDFDRGQFALSDDTLLKVEKEWFDVSNYTSQYPPAYNDTYVKVTSDIAGYEGYQATDPENLLTGSSLYNVWSTNTSTNQRFHIDLGSAKVITKIYYENLHNSGSDTNQGVQSFTFWGSNTGAGSFDDLVYANDEGWTQLTTSQTTFDQHVALDQADPKYITVTNSTAYRYYAFKFADNYGNASYMGVRRIELQTQEQKAIYHVKIPSISPSVDTDYYFYYDNDADHNTEYISDLTSTLTEESAIDDVDSGQGVATDGTYIYSSGNDTIYKLNMNGELVDSHANANLDGTDMAQANSIHIYDDKLYVGSSNWDTEPKLGYIKVFNADTLEYIEEHQVLNYWSEGCAYHDGYFWVVYSDWKYVSKYNTSWEHQADYAVDFPTTGAENISGYQGITWKGDDIFCPIHATISPNPMVDRYHWTGSAFERRERITSPADATQGICYLESNDRFYIAQRNHPETGQSSVTITVLNSSAAARQVWVDYVAVYHMADATTSTILDSTSNNNDGTKTAANEPIEAAGKVGQGQESPSDNAEEEITLGNDSSLDITGNLTLEAIIYPTGWGTVGDYSGFIGRNYSSPYNGYLLGARNDHKFMFQVANGGVRDFSCIADDTYVLNTNWYYVAGVRVGNIQSLYVDSAVQSATSDQSIGSAGSVHAHMFNYYTDTLTYLYQGILDEIRVSSTDRSPAWIKATYNSLWDSLLIYGSEERKEEGNALFWFNF